MTKLVGITGGIGSGKTTFSNHLKKLGYLVHESDVVVSEIYSKPKKQFLSFIKEKNIHIFYSRDAKFIFCDIIDIQVINFLGTDCSV